MDTLRGSFDAPADSGGLDPSDEDMSREAPPAAIGTDERRMQVRAYNHWASLLEHRNYPAIEELEPDNLPDFAPYSVLLDFTVGIENPAIAYLGAKLAAECDISAEDLETLADVPSRSLLSRITDHYMQILANQAPIGFEAEFVNQQGKSVLYRGILLPFSSDDDTIDFIYGVINWKELADQQASDELLLEIDQALDPAPVPAPTLDLTGPLTDWADGPGAVPPVEAAAPEDAEADDSLPRPSFGFDSDAFELEHDTDLSGDDYDTDEEEPLYGSLLMSSIQFPSIESDAGETPEFAFERGRAPLRKAPIQFSDENAAVDGFDAAAFEPSEFAVGEFGPDPVATDPAQMELADWLAAARSVAAAALSSEDRTRGALYEAIGRAYDFSLAASQAPDEFAALLTEAGLTRQERAPMTPVVKLVFGAGYDKTRVTEYATALTHAHRLELPRGTLRDYLAQADGGLKGVVKAERRLRREENGRSAEPSGAPRPALARKLRALPVQELAALPTEGSEFALVMIRRTESGPIALLGEVPEDAALVEKAARRLVG